MNRGSSLVSRGSKCFLGAIESYERRATNHEPRQTRAVGFTVFSRYHRLSPNVSNAMKSGHPSVPTDNTPPKVEAPPYRPTERFWPYLDLTEQPTDEELARLDPALSEALFGTPRRPFSVSLEFPPFAGADYEKALTLARASAEYLEIGQGERRRHRARFLSAGCRTPARPLPDRRPFRFLRGAHRRSTGALRSRVVAATHLVPHPLISHAPDGRPF